MNISTSTTIQEIIQEVYDKEKGEFNPIGIAKVLGFVMAMQLPGVNNTLGIHTKI